MRTLLVKFAGLTLYIHELQSSTLVLTHERPNKDPRVHKVYEEDFEDTADELEAEALEKLEPGVEASVEGLSLRLIKNDGVLNIVYEGKDGEIVDWKFQGLTGMMASVSTQTVSETQPKLSTSTIHAMAIDPAPQRMTWPLRSKLSSISSIETRPIKTLTKDEEEVPARAAVGAGENEHEHKKTKHTLRSPPHELARTTHESRPWPNHLFMACYRLRPISESDIGILHIDLVEGTVWYEAWHGRAHVSQQTYMRKQVDLRNVSTAIQESKKRKAKKRTMRVVKMANEKKVSIKKPKAAKSTETRAVKRSGQSLDTKEKEAKKAKIGRRSVEEVWRECFPGRHSE
ncbi:unnamed protein product [Alternaria alternata]